MHQNTFRLCVKCTNCSTRTRFSVCSISAQNFDLFSLAGKMFVDWADRVDVESIQRIFCVLLRKEILLGGTWANVVSNLTCDVCMQHVYATCLRKKTLFFPDDFWNSGEMQFRLRNNRVARSTVWGLKLEAVLHGSLRGGQFWRWCMGVLMILGHFCRQQNCFFDGMYVGVSLPIFFSLVQFWFGLLETGGTPQKQRKKRHAETRQSIPQHSANSFCPFSRNGTCSKAMSGLSVQLFTA